MKILRVVSLILALSLGYVLPTMAASADQAPMAGEMRKAVKGPRHHHSMSMAMMKELNLSDAQKKQWKSLTDQKKEEMKPLREQMQQLRAQEMKINEKYEGKIRKILTPEQVKKYESMLPKKPEKPMKREHPVKK